MTSAFGTGPMDALPSMRMASGRMPEGVARVTMRRNPVTRRPTKSVEMNGWTFRFATRSPLPTPISAPAASTTGRAIHTRVSDPFVISASVTPASCMTAATERSIPPEITTTVCPTARMPNAEACLRMLKRFFGWKKTGETMAARMTTTSRKT